jgi:hypothetical protein
LCVGSPHCEQVGFVVLDLLVAEPRGQRDGEDDDDGEQRPTAPSSSGVLDDVVIRRAHGSIVARARRICYGVVAFSAAAA